MSLTETWTGATGRVRVPAVLAVVGLAMGYLSVRDLRMALLLPVIPVALLLFLRPMLAVTLAVSLLPVQHAILGSEGGAAVVSAADAVFLVAFAGLFTLVLLREEWRERLKAARPALLFAVPFVGWLLIVLAAHLSGHSAFKTVTAVEITVFPLVLGASVLDRRHARAAMIGFVLMAVPLAVLWITGASPAFAGNKNGAGQYLSVAVLLAVVLAAGHPWRYIAVPLLFVGMLYTASRGALIGTAMGAIVLLAVRGLGSWKRTATAAVTLTTIVLVGVNSVPASVQTRFQAILHAQASTDQQVNDGLSSVQRATNYNLAVRTHYREDALVVIRQHPILGVGTGNYFTGSGTTITVDPHNLVLRVAAEGGLPDAALFLLFVAGSTLLVVRRLGANPWAGPALAIQTASIAHGLVDVYWIRGIPVLGWLLVGMALNPLLDRDRDATG